MSLSNLKIEALRRSDDSKNVSVEDLLDLIKADLTDMAQPYGCIVCVIDRKPDGSEKIHDYRCGLDRAEELAYYMMGTRIVADEWSS